jgi:hypothetical protein
MPRLATVQSVAIRAGAVSEVAHSGVCLPEVATIAVELR